MKKKECYLFVFNGYADWEPALAIATLNKYSNFSIHPFSLDGLSVESMGGIRIQPETSLPQIDPDDIDLLILPGGDSWNNGNEEIAALVKKVAERKGNIAAICDATVFLARHGYLNRIWHTSNGPEYLSEKLPFYRGRQYYEDLPCVVDENIITANGAGMVEFAIEILKQQKVMDDAALEKIFNLYKSGGVKSQLFQ